MDPEPEASEAKHVQGDGDEVGLLLAGHTNRLRRQSQQKRAALAGRPFAFNPEAERSGLGPYGLALSAV